MWRFVAGLVVLDVSKDWSALIFMLMVEIELPYFSIDNARVIYIKKV